MDILSSNQLFDSLSTSNLLLKAIITIIVVYIAQLIESSFAKKNRAILASKQRGLYYRKLEEEKLKMEEKDLEKELEQVKSLETFKDENNELRSQFEDDYDREKNDDDDDDEYDSSSSQDIEEKITEEKKELEALQEKAEKLKVVEDEISNSLKNLKKDDVLSEPITEPPSLPHQPHIDNDDYSGKHLSALQQLTDRIKQIETENEQLKAQVKSYSTLALAKQQSKLDPDLQQYLEDHSDVLTLDFLEKAHETLLEIKAMHPDKNFEEYMEELRCAQSNFDSELERLRVSKKEAEIKLKILKQEYEKELTSFNEIRVEHILKNSGAKELLDSLREKNKLNNEMIENLKYELETLKAAFADCEMRYHKAEIEYDKMFQGYQQIKVEKEQMEAERRAKERRMLNQTINLSSASSLVESSIPPIPPLNNIPSIDELLGGSPHP